MLAVAVTYAACLNHDLGQQLTSMRKVMRRAERRRPDQQGIILGDTSVGGSKVRDLPVTFALPASIMSRRA